MALQVHQRAGAFAAGHDVMIPDALQIPLGDGDVHVSHDSGQAVDIQTILQLHVGERMAAGVRADADGGGDTDFPRGLFQDFAHIHMGQQFAAFGEKQVVVLDHPVSEVSFTRAEVADQLFAEVGRFRHDTFLVALAMSDDDVIAFDIINAHHDHLVASNAGIEQQGDDGLVSDAQIVGSRVVAQHPADFLFGEGLDDDLGFAHVLDLSGGILLDIPFSLQIVEQGFVGFEQIVDVIRLAALILFHA